MEPLLWVLAGSLILNNFIINVNRSQAHINERINSLGLVAFQLTICKQCKMLSNFVPSNDTRPRRAENQAQVSPLGGKGQADGRKEALQLVGGLPGALQENSSAQCVGVQQEGQTQLTQGIKNVMKGGKENSQK